MISLRAVSIARSMTRSALCSSACTQQYIIKSPSQQKRGFSLNSINMVDPRRVVSFDDISKYTQQSDKVIIDVRNPDEVASTGKIPSSINIPLGNVEPALKSMSDEQFRQHYQRNKPQPSSELIFYCKSGRRACQALDKALQLGYSNSKTYVGSWDEWSSKSGQK
ncbi:rhodanese domain-containing protein CG4456-like isoform X1 [Cydia fagiglandana]|uniref:rhodanese domain-containing protein CG4456-like isoform X1 n=2 Tax=Cydia fagiglandana TaxID=1458189 RepID=UPI002FEE1C09